MRFPDVFHATNLFADLSFQKIVRHLTLLQGFVSDTDDVGFNIPSWAISVEFWTYMFLPSAVFSSADAFFFLANYFLPRPVSCSCMFYRGRKRNGMGTCFDAWRDSH